MTPVEIGVPGARIFLSPAEADHAVGWPATLAFEAGPLSGELPIQLLQSGGEDRWSKISVAQAIERAHKKLLGEIFLHALEDELRAEIKVFPNGLVRGVSEIRFPVAGQMERARLQIPFDIDQSYLPALASGFRSNFPGL